LNRQSLDGIFYGQQYYDPVGRSKSSGFDAKKNCMKQNSKHETERTTIENMGRSMALLLSLSVARNEGSLLQYSQRGES